MGKQFKLTTTDKHSLGAYRADPAGTPKGGMVVVQEIFGVNHHIRAVCDRLAALGYVAVAPAVFDRFVRDFECGYTPDEIAACAQPSRQSQLGHTDGDIAAGEGDLKGVGPARRHRLLHGRHRARSWPPDAHPRHRRRRSLSMAA